MEHKNQTSERCLHTTLLSVASIILILTMIATLAHSAEVTFQWNSVAEADGYKFYYGDASRTYQTPEEILGQSQTTLTISLDPGIYYFSITAFNEYGESGYSEEVGPTTITADAPPTSVSLTSDLASPQPADTSVTFTAQANGGSGNYEYRFWLRNAQEGEWSIVQDYSPTSSFAWNVTAGIDRVHVWAKNAGANDDDRVWSEMPFSTDMNPPASVSLTSNLASPQSEGMTVTFTAQANGGSGSYEYKFWLRNPDGQWAMLQDYSSSPNYDWNTAGFVGTSYMQVWARNAGSTEAYQVYDSSCCVVSADANPPTSVSLSSNLPTPQTEGTIVTFSAEVTGGSGSCEYKYYLCSPDGLWSMAQDYSLSPNYTWNTTGFFGTSYLQVWVRNAGSTDAYQVWNSTKFSTDMNQPTSVSLGSNITSPQPEGTMVTFSAEVTGGSGSYEYKYYLCSPDGQWSMVQDYSSSPNYIWNTTAFVGTSHLQVWVRNAGSSAKYQVYVSFPYEVE